MSCTCGNHTDHPTDTPSGLSALRVGRRALLTGSAIVGATAVMPGLGGVAGANTRAWAFLPARPSSEQHVRPIMFPVLPDPTLGKASWSDTYGAPRGGGRLHEGQDLMGNKMLKLLACVDGTVEELRHRESGNSLYIKGDDGWYYCYLHINNDTPGTDDGSNKLEHAFAPGLKAGDRVKQGQHVAYLGDSGNAENSGAHLHFEIRMPNARWYNAAAVNPKPSLDAAKPAVLGGGGPTATVDPSVFAPFSSAAAFVAQQHKDFLGPNVQRSADDAVTRLSTGATDPDRYIAELATGPGSGDIVGPTIRLYLGYFLRQPDTTGIKFWVDAIRGGRGLDRASAQFAGSPEFLARYGQLDNTGFVNLIYRNLFDRTPEKGGFEFWTTKLAEGADRGWFMRQMCETDEYVAVTKTRIELLIVHVAMLQRTPSNDEFVFWEAWLDQGNRSLAEMAKSLRANPSYAARF